MRIRNDGHNIEFKHFHHIFRFFFDFGLILIHSFSAKSKMRFR